MLTEQDIYLFKEGTHSRLYEKFGCQLAECDGAVGAHFSVWAPNAQRVTVIGVWNGWQRDTDPLAAREDGSGVWEGFVPGVLHGQAYKYFIESRLGGYQVEKADPFAFCAEPAPQTGSRAWNIDYEWGDAVWMSRRSVTNALNAPLSIYEMHLGSWRRVPEEGNRFLSYREIALPLAEYLIETGFTHVELLPVTEHPFYGSWGYQTTGYFAPTSRYGDPEDFMYLVDTLHQHGIGVIIDWVPSHFPSDEHGLVYFDGTALYEHADPKQGFHPEWTSQIFNYGRNEVRGFLVSSALYWLDRFHVDGLRVDGVASMLYLDYGRSKGAWVPNRFGGRENIEAVEFLRLLNQAVYRDFPDVQTMAEESTSWPMVSRPVYLGGLGFGLKWNMGWMHDSLKYLSLEPVHRKYHHSQLTFSIWYAFFENFLLPLSHDEVVYGKGSLINKMPGDAWQQCANLRLLFGYMWGHPGKKLLFMGGEFGQRSEWAHEGSLEWHLLQYPEHEGLRRWVTDLNRLYRSEPALYQQDFDRAGFEWVDCNDSEQSVLTFLRRPQGEGDTLLVVCNFTPIPRTNYIIGVPEGGYWREIANSDATLYGGSGVGNLGGVESAPVSVHGRYHSLVLTLPPLSTLMFKREVSHD
ncbi:MAG: 1,4-alpha-glucan branching protein GlgB [Desulfuromonadaceae bacterium]|nr:1,4-alpha-glucan branching protein GlgB [Desulfuromonadaceae bacterium]